MQALELLAPVLLDARHALRGEAAAVGHHLWLVVHVALVEARQPRHRGAGEGVAVTRSGGRRLGPRRIVGVDRPAAVRGHVPERHVERARGGGGVLDQADGAPGGLIGLVLAGALRRRVGAQHAVLVDLPARVVEGARVRAAVPVGVAGRDAVAVVVAVEVATHVHRPVARSLKPDGHGVGAVEGLEAPERTAVREHSVVVCVLTGEVGGPGRAAEREAREGLVEAGALAAEQAVQLRHGGHAGGRLVIGHDHDHVRLGESRRRCEGRRREHRHDDQREFPAHESPNTAREPVLREAAQSSQRPSPR